MILCGISYTTVNIWHHTKYKQDPVNETEKYAWVSQLYSKISDIFLETNIEKLQISHEVFKFDSAMLEIFRNHKFHGSHKGLSCKPLQAVQLINQLTQNVIMGECSKGCITIQEFCSTKFVISEFVILQNLKHGTFK